MNGKRAEKLLSVILIIALFVAHGNAGIVYAEDTSDTAHGDAQIVSEGSESTNALGYVKADVDISGFLHKETPGQKAASLPSSYSLADKGYVTSVKSQSPYGTCWTFATTGSAESGLKKKYGATTDLSELQLAYFVYNCYQKEDPMNLITNDGNYSDYSDVLDLGGNSFYSTFALASGIGFTDESAYPYTEAESYISDGTAKKCYNTTYRLRSARWLNMSEPETIKQALMDHGALAVAFYYNSHYFNGSTYAYYQNYSDFSNHAVTLIGWDDDYPKENFNSDCRPSSNGAWLLKNSWGAIWGDYGFFWISYEEISLIESEAVFFEAEMGEDVPEEYFLYQYDGSASLESRSMKSPFYIANVFETAANEENITDVGFVAGQADTQYTIYIYKNVADVPTSGVLAHTQSGSLDDAGYYLIELSEPISLSKGEKYSVVIRQSSSSSMRMYVDSSIDYGDGIYRCNDVTNDISFKSSDGENWSDLTKSGFTARIKAVTVKTNVAPTETTVRNYGSGILVQWDRVPGATGYVIYRRAWNSTAGGWTAFARWNNTKERSFLDTKVYEGTKYQYGIKAYYGDDPKTVVGLGPVSPLVAITYYKKPEAPAKLTAVNTSDGVKLSWDAVKDAGGYVIYRRAWKSGDPTWSTDFTRWNNTTDLSFVDTQVYNGTKYQYGIKAYYGDDPKTVPYLGPVSPLSVITKKMIIGAPTELEVVNSAEGIELSWDAVKNATGYIIYRRAWSETTNSWTAFQRWNNTKSTTWTDNKVYAGTKYQYGIKAYYGNDPKNMAHVGEVGPLVMNIRVTARKLLSVAVTNDDYGQPLSIYYEWDRSSLFSGYQTELKIRETGKVTTKTTTILDQTRNTFTTEAEQGKSYSFKVRSFYELDGVKYYGAWSEESEIQL